MRRCCRSLSEVSFCKAFIQYFSVSGTVQFSEYSALSAVKLFEANCIESNNITTSSFPLLALHVSSLLFQGEGVVKEKMFSSS